MISGKDSGIRTVGDLQGPQPWRIAIVSARSGVAVTFDYMKTLVQLIERFSQSTDTQLL